MNNLFIMALFTYQFFFHHKKRHLSIYITGILFQTLALLLVSHRNTLDFLYTVQISNLFLISSFALTSYGLISFDGRSHKYRFWIFSVFTILFYTAFLAVSDNSLMRIIIQIIASATFYGIGAYCLYRNNKKYKFAIILSLILLSYSVFQLVRAGIIYNIGESYNFMDGSSIDNYYLIISVFVISASSIGLIMLLKEIDQETILQKNTKIKEDKRKLKTSNTTKDKLFSVIAHDLRGPFNNIIGISDLLIGKEKEDYVAESERYVGLINSSAKDSLNLLDNLLSWAKSQTGQLSFEPEKIELSSLLKKVINSSNSRALLKAISIHTIQHEEVDLYANKDMVMIVLRNLISNAIKFTNTGGEIKVIVTPSKKDVAITISDNGIGMSDERIKTLFKISSHATSRGTANEKGSGLGLVLCKEFIGKSGGHIEVESKEGAGSHFKFTLPLHRS